MELNHRSLPKGNTFTECCKQNQQLPSPDEARLDEGQALSTDIAQEAATEHSNQGCRAVCVHDVVRASEHAGVSCEGRTIASSVCI